MVTKKEEKELAQEIAEATRQLHKIAGGEPVSADILQNAVKASLENNRQKVLVAFLDGDEVSVVHLSSANLNNADFIKRIMGG